MSDYNVYDDDDVTKHEKNNKLARNKVQKLPMGRLWLLFLRDTLMV